MQCIFVYKKNVRLCEEFKVTQLWLREGPPFVPWIFWLGQGQSQRDSCQTMDFSEFPRLSPFYRFPSQLSPARPPHHHDLLPGGDARAHMTHLHLSSI